MNGDALVTRSKRKVYKMTSSFMLPLGYVHQKKGRPPPKEASNVTQDDIMTLLKLEASELDPHHRVIPSVSPVPLRSARRSSVKREAIFEQHPNKAVPSFDDNSDDLPARLPKPKRTPVKVAKPVRARKRKQETDEEISDKEECKIDKNGKEVKHRKKIINCSHVTEEYYAKGMCKNCYHNKGRTKLAT